ncbi:unnamed protein product [Calypogeia fissa]
MVEGRERNMAKNEPVGYAAEAEDEKLEKWMMLDVDDDVLPSQIKPVRAAKRGRGKLILLEDILAKRKRLQTGTKRGRKGAKKPQDSDSSDEEYSSGEHDEIKNDAQIQQVEKTLIDFSKVIGDGGSEVHVKWGEKVFGPQKLFPDFTIPESDNGLISRILSFEPQQGKDRMSTAASMASSGLLLSWAVLQRGCDETTARWLFHQMAYSDNKLLEKGACKILCDLLTRCARDGRPSCKLEWIPRFEDIKDIFHVYGYLETCDDEPEEEKTGSADLLSQEEPTESGEAHGPPLNIRSLLQFLVPVFQSREWYKTLSTSEAESLVFILLHCQLDRCMLNVSNLLQSCFEAIINNFTEEEWISSCQRIGSAISRISSTFVNNLKIAKSLHATNIRLGSLQRLVVLQLLSRCVEAKRTLASPEDVVSIFKSVNIKESMYNFLNLYHVLILADIFFWSTGTLTKTKKVFAIWLDFLKKCSTQISLQDSRPYAMKVRNWASFLSQKYQVERMQNNSATQ